MSGLLLCAKQSGNPYYIADLDINVYSVEELSYFLYNHIYMIGEDFFKNDLADYFENELNLPDSAEGLRELIDGHGAFSEMVLFILKESNYYNEKEINEITDVLRGMGANSLHRRLKAKSEFFFNYNRTISAYNEYKKILSMKREEELGAEFYADILNNIGVIMVKAFLYEEATGYFKKAYEVFPADKYMKSIVLLDLMVNDERSLLNNIREFNISEELLRECKQEFLRRKEEAENQEEYIQLNDLFSLEGKPEPDNYYKALQDTVNKWKTEYREMFVL